MTTVPLPVYDDRTVRQSNQGNEYYRMSASPDDAGAQIGQAMQGAGRQLSHVADQFAATVNQKDEEERALRIQDKLIQHQQATNDLLYKDATDPVTGQVTRKAFYSLNGEDAVNARPELDKTLTSLNQKLLQGVTDPREQRILQQRAASYDQHTRTQADVKTLQERQQWKTSTERGKIGAIVDGVSNGDWKDTNWLEGQRKELFSFIAANHQGEGPEAIAQTQKQAWSEITYNHVAKLADQDVMAASDFATAEQAKGTFTADHALKLQKIIGARKEAHEIQGVVQQSISGAGTAGNAARALVPTDQQGGKPVPPEVADPPPVASRPEAQRAGSLEFGSSPITSAVAHVESSDGKNREGPEVIVGGKPTRAYGAWQMLPETARAMSLKAKDGFINSKMSEAEIGNLLKSNDTLAEYYATMYLQEGLEKYGSLEAAIIQYHAGPGGVDKWVAAGRDPNALGPKTRDYLGKVLDRYADLTGAPGHTRPIADPTETVAGGFRGTLAPDHSRRLTRETWNQSTLGFYKPQDLLPPTGGFVDERSAQMLDRLATMFTSQHPGVIPRVNDEHDFDPAKGTAGRRRGYASADDNPHVKHSQHLEGRAFDVQVQGMNPQQKADYLRMALDMGFTGIGFYGDSGHLHLDTGRARVWGNAPAWAKEVMASRPPVRGQERFANVESLNNLPVPQHWNRSNPAAPVYEAATQAHLPAMISSINLVNEPDPVPPPAPMPSDVMPPVRTGTAPAAPQGGVEGTPADPWLKGIKTATPAVALPPTSRDAPAFALTSIPGYVPLGDTSPAQARQRFEENTAGWDPVRKEKARSALETQLNRIESQDRDNLKAIKQEAFRKIYSGEVTRDNLPVELQAKLWDSDPKFWQSLGEIEKRNHKGELDNDGLVIWSRAVQESVTNPQAFLQRDLAKYATLLPKEQFTDLVNRQARMMNESQDATDLGGSLGPIIEAAKTRYGLDDKVAGLLLTKIEAAREQYKAENAGKKMPPSEIQKQVEFWTQPTYGGTADRALGTNKKLLIEYGDPTENANRVANKLPMEDYTNFTASSYEEIPAGIRMTVENNLRVPGVGEKYGGGPMSAVPKAQVQQVYSDALKAAVGLPVEPPENVRRWMNEQYKTRWRQQNYPDAPNGSIAMSAAASQSLNADQEKSLYGQYLTRDFPMVSNAGPRPARRTP
jgi:hypothetical protein